MLASLPGDRSIEMVARLRSPRVNHPQSIEVEVDGRPLGRWNPRADSFDEYSLRIPPDPQRPEVSTISFRFSRYRQKDSQGQPLAAMFDSVTLRSE